MENLKLDRRDGLFIAVCLAVLIVGVIVSVRYFHAAFPEATIDFRYNRTQAGDIGLRFLDSLSLTPPTDYRHSSRFGYDGNAKTYLEKELGVEGARPFLGHPIRLWYWQHRWFSPGKKEEFGVWISPEGEIVRVNHDVPEGQSGATIETDSARAMADGFLSSVMNLDSTKLDFLSSERIGRPSRTDWTFTYKARGIEPVKDSEYRYEIGITGDKLSSYREFLHVPQAWFASFSRLRSYNEMAGQFASFGLMLTAIAMVATIFIRIRRRIVHWKTALIFGGVAVALQLFNQINDLPLTFYWYDTTTTWSGFLLQKIAFGLLESLGAGLLIFLVVAAAETLYRERFPQTVSMINMFSLRGLQTKYAFKSILLGTTLTAFFFAYQIVFYLVADRFGAWSPSDVPYDNLLNTAMPWLAVLAMGFFPAVSEEFIDRVFSITFLSKAFRNRMIWLAVLISAAIWGFGHAGYPNQPFWIRGAEVGVAGIIMGIIMLRFGIMAPLVWHYTVDALYTAFLLFRSHNPYFIVTAAVATGLLVLPILLALIAYLRRGSFLPATGLLNQDEASSAPEIPAEPVAAPAAIPSKPAYLPLSTRSRILAVILAVAGITAAIIPVSTIGDFLKYPLKRGDAIRIFADSLRSSGWANPDTLRMAAYFSEAYDIGADQSIVYLLKHVSSVDSLNQIADKRLGYGRWQVVAWVPENRLRFMGSVHARTGRIESLHTWLPEEMPGDSLSTDSAQTIAFRSLIAMGEDTSVLVLKEHHTDAKPHRFDHNFDFEAKPDDPRHIGEAKYRRTISMDGARLRAPARPYYHVPEEWKRARQADTGLRTTIKVLRILAIIGFGLWCALLLSRRIRRGEILWKKAFLLALIPALAEIAGLVSYFYLEQRNYFFHVEEPWAVYRAGSITGAVVSVVFGYLISVLGIALLLNLFSPAQASDPSPRRRAFALDLVLSALSGIAVVLLWKSAIGWIEAAWPAGISLSSWGISEWLASPISGLDMMRGTVMRFLLMAFEIGVFAYLWVIHERKPLLRILAAILAVLIVFPADAIEPAEWAVGAIGGFVLLLLAFGLLRYVLPKHPLLAAVSIFAAAAYGITSRALGVGNSIVTVNAGVWAICCVVILAVFYIAMTRKHSA